MCIRDRVKTNDGASFLHTQDAYWRVYDFVEDTICLQLPETDEDFYQDVYKRQLSW